MMVRSVGGEMAVSVDLPVASAEPVKLPVGVFSDINVALWSQS